MISPDEIRAKVKRLYPRAVQAWLQADSQFFPCRLPCNLETSPDVVQRIREVDQLRQGSAEVQGQGYRIQWELIHSRTQGTNRFPVAIYLDALPDIASLAGKKTELAKLQTAVQLIRKRLPELEQWLHGGWRKLLEVEAVEPLIAVTEYLMAHPRPNLFMRELPLPVSTKLIENNRTLLGQWWDQLLPASAIDFSAAGHFEQRYGFRYVREHILLRLLDSSLRTELHLPFGEISLDQRDLATLPVTSAQVLIVENKINLLTLPAVDRGLALGGLGAAALRLCDLPWLAGQRVWYWGDMDAEGFELLARFRQRLPSTGSLMMDMAIWNQHLDLVCRKGSGAGKSLSTDCLELLTPDEQSVYIQCCQQGVWLEQERIPQATVVQCLRNVTGQEG